ncbi:MAG: SoxR reducing system RseC family protein [Candidatus Margulisbacteria bacterium]|nr:SoxR reducing system RseC family protein [Candidatus Margulisiibacteriota bacterium]MBU1021787.1 SoxR reducing system RseC family protein [Candidatus Margulisiibacteriota bacterium]MBU1729533.1 SoxR reducing system RseC family protein [Candidatus Margulisiibacteriota bacterium]MBU1955366.1 SoxR reducing system RseC family protein [Candidatus Margulisiibacteriota bacterium]
MREQGVVSKIISDKLAEVQFEPQAVCAKCKACCHLVETGKMVVEVWNDIGAKVGDPVEVEVPEKQVVASAFLIYIFPLICLILGYFVGSYFSQAMGIFKDSELLGIIIGFIFMALAFLALRVYDNYLRLSGKFKGKIVGK